MIYILLGIISIPVLVFLAAQDIKERMIYSFPVLILSACWAVYSAYLYRNNPAFIMAAWLITAALYIAYRVFSVWGDGDSDMFLLFTGIILCSFEINNVLQFMFILSVSLVFSQLLALLGGIMEAKLKKMKLTRHSGIAVVPGFSVILMIAIVFGILRKAGIV